MAASTPSSNASGYSSMRRDSLDSNAAADDAALDAANGEFGVVCSS
jgi:hypothetical protein